MTAEERAAEVVERLMRDQCLAQEAPLTQWHCTDCSEQHIAEAIRAAEAEAWNEGRKSAEAARAADGGA